MDNKSGGTMPASTKRMRTSADSYSRKRRVGVWLARCVLAVGFLAGLYFSVVPMGRAQARAVLILPDLLSASLPPWQAPAAEPISSVQTTMTSSTGTVYLDIYSPTARPPVVPGAWEGMLFIPGVGDERFVPQVVNLSKALARIGIVTMVMTTPALIANRLDVNDENAVVQALHVLQRWPGVDPKRVGFFGVSGGGALLSFAAADPRTEGQVAFVALIGSYFDATMLLENIGRRAQVVNGQMEPWQPTDYTLEVLTETLVPVLSNTDASLLLQAFGSGQEKPLSPDQVAQLSPGSQAFYHLLAGDQPGHVRANMAAMPAAAREHLADLSPSRVIGNIHAPVYLLADRNDQFVPASQSVSFAAALASLHRPYDFAEFGIFQHAEVRSNLSISPQVLGDSWHLFLLLTKALQVGT